MRQAAGTGVLKAEEHGRGGIRFLRLGTLSGYPRGSVGATSYLIKEISTRNGEWVIITT